MAPVNSNQCLSCGTEFQGRFCSNCGEKIVHDKDFSFSAIFRQAFSFITNFDSKLFKSFYYLLFKPGKLTAEYVIGRRKPYMNPFQIFVIANILFFFFLTNADIFRAPAKWFFPQKGITQQASQIANEKNISLEELALIYDAKSSSLSKGAIAVFIPLIGLLFMLIQFKKKLLFGKHAIAAVHFFSFFMTFSVILGFVLSMLPFSNKYIIQASLSLSIFLYLLFTYKNFYGDSIGRAIGKGIISTFIILALLLSYRNGISHLSLNLL